MTPLTWWLLGFLTGQLFYFARYVYSRVMLARWRRKFRLSRKERREYALDACDRAIPGFRAAYERSNGPRMTVEKPRSKP